MEHCLLAAVKVGCGRAGALLTMSECLFVEIIDVELPRGFDPHGPAFCARSGVAGRVRLLDMRMTAHFERKGM